METEKVYAMPFAKNISMLVEKAARKGRTQAEVDEIIGWLTGYSVGLGCGAGMERCMEISFEMLRSSIRTGCS